jgi:3-hydroxyisobutyrate dehydrogenase-like beta-hydroxyacid dehydrogenase
MSDEIRVGLVGIGSIGSHYTTKLLEAGFPLTVYDIDAQKIERAVAQGAQAGASPGDVAAHADVILLSLPGSPQVEAVMSGKDGILTALQAGQLVVDTGTTRVSTELTYHRLCNERGAGYIDSPITWRQHGLLLMVGGPEDLYQRALPVLECISYKVQRVGEIGQGQALKYVNQLVQAGELAVFCEAIEFARAAGLDLQLPKEYLGFPIPDVIYGDTFEGTGQLALHYKDLGYVLEHAHELYAATPITNLVHEIFKAVAADGDPSWFQPAIVTYWRRLNSRSTEEQDA